MNGKSGNAASVEADRLAALHLVSKQHIYDLTKHLRPKRKRRAAAGRRTFELKENSELWKAAQLVVSDKLDPDQALLTCQTRGLNDLPSLAYFQKILREKGLGKKQRRSAKRPFRFWESEFPGEMYQIDVTALKVRWEDEKTRRILRIEGVDKNHPNPGDNKIRVWQIMAVDDHSRRRFLRYVATTHITSRDMVEFQCELFAKWGVPRKLYTDNGAEFKGYNVRAEKILDTILAGDGGYFHQRHAPGNSQASGKVEVAHKWAEKMDRYVGLAISEGQKVTVADLNPFADAICENYNSVVVQRTIQTTPMTRWFAKRIVVRKLPVEIIESALLSDEFETTLNDSMTVAHKGISYRVRGVQPFVNYINQKINVVVPINIDLILIKLPGDEEFREIEKVLAVADNAGDFKSHAESTAQQLTKRLKETRKQEIKAIKEKSKQTGEIAPVPFYNVRIETPATNVAHFPHQERIFSPEEIAAVTPVAPSFLSPKEISYWEAVVVFGDRFNDVEEAKEFLLTIFGDGEIIAETELETAIDNRQNQQQPARIYAVK